MYNCLIVDDEKLARVLIASYLDQFQDFTVIGECSTGLEAMQFIGKNNVDLIFLDINMPQVSGIDLLRQNNKLPPTILCTAHSEYAVESYDLDVVDYLLKPISLVRFAKAIEKFRSRSNPSFSQPSESLDNSIFIKSDHKLVKIKLSQIQYIEAMEKYVRIHTTNQRHLSLMSMTEINKMLPGSKFMRIHRSYIIALSKVDSVEGNMAIINDQKLPISKGNRKEFKSRLIE